MCIRDRLWLADTPEHPVIGQEMYKYYDGRFQQIGFSWLKHAFCALSEDLCTPCAGTNCDTLGIGCSDPYTALRNGAQGNLGPRSLVDAHTGSSPYPYSAPPYAGLIAGRVQVSELDLNPTLNPGA